jgi:hypothetical protein
MLKPPCCTQKIQGYAQVDCHALSGGVGIDNEMVFL